MSLSSHTLFHFTHSLDTLQAILQSGFRYSPTYEKIAGRNLAYMAEMVCFCNIPLSQIMEHCEWYGSYGIGVTPKYGIENGATPVMYVHSKSPVLPKGKELEAKYDSLIITPYLKRYAGKQRKYKCSKMHYKDFYDEKEWRSVHSGFSMHAMNDLNDLNQMQADERSTHKNFTFTKKLKPEDIMYVIVKSRSEIPQMTVWLQSNGFSSIPPLISMDMIKKDF